MMIRTEIKSENGNTFDESSLVPIQTTTPLLLTEEEVVALLRIPEICKTTDYKNVIKNLKRMHDLPCIHICKKPLYPLEAIREWILDKVEKERKDF